MTDPNDATPTKSPHTMPSVFDPDGLWERYGGHLGESFDEAQAKLHLSNLARIMMAFVDLGFSVAPGEKLHKNSDLSMDDVLNYIHRVDIEHETVAPPKSKPGEEQQ